MNTLINLTTLALAALLAGLAAPASAHVVLEQPQAAAGSAYKAQLRVGHGCQGSPTHTVLLQLPAGLRGAKPQAKPGWTTTLRRAPLAQPYESHGKPVADELVEVRWQARSREDWLDDAQFDEFVVRAQLPSQPGPLWFKISQLCEQGRLDWTELPAQGSSTQGLKSPAALLQVLPAAPATGRAGGHQH